MFRLIDITIDIIFFSINWKNYFDRSILVISMTVLEHTRTGTKVFTLVGIHISVFSQCSMYNVLCLWDYAVQYLHFLSEMCHYTNMPCQWG